MSAHTKGRPTETSYLEVIIGMPSNKKMHYKIPNTKKVKEQLVDFLETCTANEIRITPWEQAEPWGNLAADRIKKHSKTGLALRGARYREGISQKELAKRSGVSQDNISRIENGKRLVGEKVARKLAHALHMDYRLFIESP